MRKCMRKNGKKLLCPRCTHRWNYRGGSKWWATCPNCRTTVKIGDFVYD